MTKTKDRHSAHGTKGRVLHSAAAYDLLAWLLLFGREGAFRKRLVALARLEPGDAVLDVGCGTGSLAIAAKRRVGPSGTVQGVDASPEMIARAIWKARKAGVDVSFTNAVVEALPFADKHFDAVLSTMMLHHLPRQARDQCAREMRRVLESGGRVLAVDFGGVGGDRNALIGHFHRHGRLNRHDIVKLLSDAGFMIIESGAVGVWDLNFVLATA